MKKRKKWIDCKVELKENKINIKCDDDGDEATAKRPFLFQGNLDEKLIPRLLGGEETRVGGCLVQILIEQEAVVKENVPRPTNILKRPKLQHNTVLPNKNVVFSKNQEKTSSVIALSEGNTCNEDKVEDDRRGDSNDIGGQVDSAFSAGEIRIHITSNIGKNKSNIMIHDDYHDELSYARDFLSSLCEEINLNITSTARDFENRASRALKINIQSSHSVTNTAATGSSSSALGISYSRSVSLTNRALPSLEKQWEFLRTTAQIPLAHSVDLIVSPPRQEHPGSGSRGAGTWKKKAEDEAQAEEDAPDTRNELVKLFLKLPVAQRQAPSGCDAYSKGDIWAIWDATASSGNGCSSARREYLEARRRGYPFPWWGGSVWQAVWLMRFVRHGVSGEGLAEVTFVCASSSVVTKDMGRLPIGRVRGALDTRFLGVRLFSESSTMIALDLLREGSLLPAQRKQMGEADAEALHFDSLSASPAFSAIIGPSHHGATPADRVAKSPPGSQGLCPCFAFPAVSEEGCSRVLADVQRQFGLNNDQISVLQRVSLWFSGVQPPVSATKVDSNDNVVLVQGVFGSGKSHMLAALAVLVKRLSSLVSANDSSPYVQVRIMVSANTNVAVDRVLAQLLAQHTGGASGSGSDDELVWPSVVRVGAVQRVAKCLRPRLVVSGGADGGSCGQVEALVRQDNDPHLLELLQDLRTREPKRGGMLKTADVIGVTCASAANLMLLQSKLRCHILILDEATQMTEPTSLLPLACCSPLKLVLVGDPKQLPPITATTTIEAPEGRGGRSIARPLFGRLLDRGLAAVTLRTQYRCHPTIGSLCSRLFYDNAVTNGVSEEDRPPLLPGLAVITLLTHPRTQEEKAGESFVNPVEAKLVQELLSSMCSAISTTGQLPFSIGVICMYREQARLIARLVSQSSLLPLRSLLEQPGGGGGECPLRISTVDAFQGSEKDVVVLVTSRTTPERGGAAGATGFISNAQRVNVSISRARSHLIVVGAAPVLQSSPLWRQVCEEAGRCVSSVGELFPYTQGAPT